MNAPAIPVSVLLEALNAMDRARVALCQHPDDAVGVGAAYEIAAAAGKLRAHVEHVLPSTVGLAT